jgi:diguanylate cyclase (GGDEF)-like protein
MTTDRISTRSFGKVVHDSIRRTFSRKRLVAFLLFTAVVAAILLVLVIGDSAPKPLRIVFAGTVFAFCLVGSIIFGIPSGALSAIANLGGTAFAVPLFQQTGDWYYLAICVFQVTTAISSIIIAILADMERSKKESHRDASLTDALTDVYNSRFFRLRLDEEITRAERSEHSVSLLLIDVNSFKSINDDFGHSEGDRVLRAVASFLQQTTRTSDIVCRYGGDEFAIILPDTGVELAAAIAVRTTAAVPEHMAGLSGLQAREVVSLSIGYATYPADADNQVSLFEQADSCLYREKRRFYEGRDPGAQTGA